MPDKVAPGGNLTAADNFRVLAGRDGGTGDGGNESSQSWDEGEEPHGLAVSWKECDGLRECEVAESAKKERDEARGRRVAALS